MTDDIWPPPPEGQRSSPTQFRAGGVDIVIDHDYLHLTFASSRRALLTGALICTAGLGLGVAGAYSMHLGRFLIYLRTHPARILQSVFLVFYTLWSWLMYYNYGRYTLSSVGTFNRRNVASQYGVKIKYVKVVGYFGRTLIRLGLDPLRLRPESASWVALRSSTRHGGEITLGGVKDRAAARRIAKIIGDFLGLPVIEAG